MIYYYADCYKETIFGMLIMTKLQQLLYYSISLLTQLSFTLTYIVLYMTPSDSTLQLILTYPIITQTQSQ